MSGPCLTLLTRTEPARRTALIAQELRRYNVDIAALAETRLPVDGAPTESRGGYTTFFWKGLPQTERRIHGVGFAVRNRFCRIVRESLTGISARLMKLRLQINRYASIFSCYTPTLVSSEESKDMFYDSLDEQLELVPLSDKIVPSGTLMHVWTRRVWPGRRSWGVMGVGSLIRTDTFAHI